MQRGYLNKFFPVQLSTLMQLSSFTSEDCAINSTDGVAILIFLLGKSMVNEPHDRLSGYPSGVAFSRLIFHATLLLWPPLESDISHNALDRIIYTIFPPFCQVIQSCSQAWKGHNDDDLVRPVLDSKFCSLLCFLNSS